MNNEIKGYKASYNGVCRGHQYEVGKTYTIDKIKICERGFHFCKEMKIVIYYYDYNDDFVLFEVIGGAEIITEGYKTVCSQIEIVRIVPKEEYTFQLPIKEYNDNGNLIHFRHSDGYEFWRKYDENNNKINFKTSDGYEQWYNYDDHNKLISYKDSTGYERSY